ncbi:MAG: hypothetical protein DHS20C05_02890 [Hyphococcus sp.]|nr:MAG: hypothetical protein DHS20C05_02890 [Marinicaulis sp.]
MFRAALPFAFFVMTTIMAAPTPLGAAPNDNARLQAHTKALQTNGKAPIPFVLDAMEKHDLIVFDDALHNVVHPWKFYEELVRERRFQEAAPTIFLEIVPVNRQPALDAYFSTFPEDRSLLIPAFQDRYGWAYKTYYDFLHAVYVVNQGLTPENRLTVKAVSTPSYWKEIATKADWDNLNQRAVLARDYHMYQIILADLTNFEGGKKGIFLTNTRHAYTNIRKPDGSPFWNTGTFLRQWHPGKSYSVRFNAPILNIEKERRDDGSPRTAEGLDRYQYSWARVENGLWDAAFAEFGNDPVAIDLHKTGFGEASYMGNHMHKAASGQKMRDAYDGVIFMTPLEQQEASAHIDFIYTPAFKIELARRYRITRSPEQIDAMLKEENVETLEAYIDAAHQAEPAHPSGPAQAVGDINAWRTE